MSPPSVGKFFKANFSFCVSVFDVRRGQHEGEEEEKVLCFFPLSAPSPVRVSIVGFGQALTSFASTFSSGPNDGCQIMDTQNNKWVLFNGEPNIWFLLVVNKAWTGLGTANTALQSFLRTAHSLFTLLHGHVNRLLEQDPSGHAARSVLQSFIDELGGRLLRPDLHDYATLSSPLACQLHVPLLATSYRVFLDVQSLANRLLVTCVYGSRPVVGVVVMYEAYLLWSSLGAVDTTALYHLAGRALLPVAKSGGKQRLVGGAIAGGPALPCLLQPGRWQLLPTGIMTLGGGLPGAGGPLGSAAGGWTQGQLPCVWLMGGEERALLLPIAHGPVTLLLLLHESVQVSQTVTDSLQSVAATGCDGLCTALGEESGNNTLWHIKGCRYAFTDDTLLACRFTPPHKVATLAPTSLSMVTDVADKMKLTEATGLRRTSCLPSLGSSSVRSSTGDCEEDEEVVCQTFSGTWAVLRRSGPRELVVVVEHPPANSLEAVAVQVQRLGAQLAPGSFQF